MVLGKHSGRHALSERLKALGFKLSKQQLEKAFVLFKDLADKKKEVFEEDLMSIVEEQMTGLPKVWSLEGFSFCGGMDSNPQATVTLKKNKKKYTVTLDGDGPVDASYKAIEKITKINARLIDYSIQAITRGKDALGEVNLKLQIKDQEIPGRGASTDIIEASAKAYINAINRFLFKTKRSTVVRL